VTHGTRSLGANLDPQAMLGPSLRMVGRGERDHEEKVVEKETCPCCSLVRRMCVPFRNRSRTSSVLDANGNTVIIGMPITSSSMMWSPTPIGQISGLVRSVIKDGGGVLELAENISRLASVLRRES